LTVELVVLVAAVLLVVSIAASAASNRLGVPALVLFLLIGMLAGSDGPGGIAFSDPWLAQAVGVVALVFILYSGGLDTEWRRIRTVLGSGLALANLGVLASTLLVGGFATLVLGFGPLEGMLLGAIVSSTDAAAVFSVMRTRGVNLRGDLEPLIELESGTNDPIAVFLTIGITSLLIEPGASLLGLVPQFVVQMALGTLGGLVFGRANAWLLNRIRLPQAGLYSVFSLGLALLTYGMAFLIGGNGFLAVYVAGVVVGNRNVLHKRSLLQFHEGVAWLMQIAMFLALGLFVFPSQLAPVALNGVLLALFVTLVARPLSVILALAFSRFRLAEKLMVAWAGLRGAVPIVLATYPMLAGVPEAGTIFHLIFFAVLASVLLQGTTIGLVARFLGLNLPGSPPEATQLFVPDVRLNSRLLDLSIPPGSSWAGKSVMELGLPAGVLVVQVQRGEQRLVPSGATVLEAGDHVFVLATPETLPLVRPLAEMREPEFAITEEREDQEGLAFPKNHV
jgi:potassium/hydrogen antiporter